MKFIILSKRNYFTIAVCILLAALTIVVAATGIEGAVAVSTGKRKIPIYCVEKEEKVASLSFDAAWGKGEMRCF